MEWPAPPSRRLVGERTALINQLRAVLLERGIVVPQGKRKFEQYLVAMMDEHDGEGLSGSLDRCSVCISSWASVFTSTKRIVGRVAASAIPSRVARHHQ